MQFRGNCLVFKYVILIIILLILLVFAGNKLIGHKAGEIIGDEIRRQIAASPQLKSLNYEDISVDPLGGKMTIAKLEIDQGALHVSSSEASLDASLASLIGLLGDAEISKIEDFDLEMKDFELDGKEHGFELRLSELALNFDAERTADGGLKVTVNQIGDAVLKQIETALGRKIERNAAGKILLKLSDLEGKTELRVLD